MLEPTYRQALSHASKFTWHHKMAWIVGLLSLFLGQMGLSNFTGQLASKLLTDEGWWPKEFGIVRIITGEQLFWFSWTMLLVAAFIVFILVAAVCAQAALIVMAMGWYRTRVMPSISRAWHVGAKHFWGVLAINILEKLLLSAILASVVISLSLFSSSTLGLFGQILVVSAGLFLALVVATVSIYALAYTVLDKVPVVEAVGRGFTLFKHHVLVSLELAAILLFCNAILIAGISFVLLITLVLPFILTVLAGFTGYAGLLVASVSVYLFAVIFMVVLIGAIYNTFTTSAWIFFFMKMHREGLVSRIMHHLTK